MNLASDRDRLCDSISYRFESTQLLDRALTHRSALGASNERLEFLGDSVLGAIVSEALYLRYPSANEGELSRLRASLVNGSSLAELARSLNLGDYLNLGPGELKNGGYRRDSILADGLEALFGAVYLDGGYESVKKVVLNLLDSQFVALPTANYLKDPKTRLQEHIQAQQLPLPDYAIVEVSGADHARSYTVRCAAAEQTALGHGTGRRSAEQAAAHELLGVLGLHQEAPDRR